MILARVLGGLSALFGLLLAAYLGGNPFWAFVVGLVFLVPALWIILRRHTKASVTRPSLLQEAIGRLAIAAFALFSAYNIYTLLTSGQLYMFARRNSGWTSYVDGPAGFTCWTLIYSLPIIVAAATLYGRASELKRAKRATFRQFVDGTGPPPHRLDLDER
jgi:hypothetical protein